MSAEGHHRVRASDPEREEYVTILRAAITEGRLTLQEGEERIARAYAATYRDELPPTTDDLPGGGRQALHDTPEAQGQQRRSARRFRRGRIVVVVAAVAGFLTLGALSHGHFPWGLIALLTVLFVLHRRARFHRWAARPGAGWHGAGWHGAGGHGAPWHGGWRDGGPGHGGPGHGGPGDGRPAWSAGPWGGAPWSGGRWSDAPWSRGPWSGGSGAGGSGSGSGEADAKAGPGGGRRGGRPDDGEGWGR
ncbi:MAG TPA: DUF1707 domain-containing protein [Micromonosporaceae bacterium]|nr:DUF1707 domain-containing protein [Micromonosporaceae bacterium]